MQARNKVQSRAAHTADKTTRYENKLQVKSCIISAPLSEVMVCFVSHEYLNTYGVRELDAVPPLAASKYCNLRTHYINLL